MLAVTMEATEVDIAVDNGYCGGSDHIYSGDDNREYGGDRVYKRGDDFDGNRRNQI